VDQDIVASRLFELTEQVGGLRADVQGVKDRLGGLPERITRAEESIRGLQRWVASLSRKVKTPHPDAGALARFVDNKELVAAVSALVVALAALVGGTWP